MISFSEWMRFREEGAAAGGGSAPASGGGASAPPSGGGTSAPPSSGGDAPPPADSGTKTSDVAHVPMRLGGCGFCYPYCACSSCKKKRRKKRRRGRK